MKAGWRRLRLDAPCKCFRDLRSSIWKNVIEYLSIKPHITCITDRNKASELFHSQMKGIVSFILSVYYER